MMTTYRLEHKIIEEKEKYHLVSLLDFTRPDFSKGKFDKPKYSIVLKVVTTVNNSDIEHAITRIYNKEAVEDDFGKERNILEKTYSKIYNDPFTMLQGHFKTIEEVTNEYSKESKKQSIL